MFELSGVLLSILGEKTAYLDPGSGSILIQLLLAALLGAGLFFRSSWGKIRERFGGKAAAEDDDFGDDEIDE
ncbi:MAG: hypothetical protein B6I38_04290 [Anaerolineaceae bacterium 4572_5.1]|nr:MAG: hypothetical protein B5M51_03580 [Anaerolinea sp. 4484_236]OQY32739.1 MAG: hypothetical protein B6I38_04290 [Anaerolineaceae bacterium 4572_5.1]